MWSLIGIAHHGPEVPGSNSASPTMILTPLQDHSGKPNSWGKIKKNWDNLREKSKLKSASEANLLTSDAYYYSHHDHHEDRRRTGQPPWVFTLFITHC